MVSIIVLVLVLPYTLIFVFFLLLLFYFFMRKYMRTSLELRRLTIMAVSPILARLGEAIVGVSVVRAFDKLDWLRKSMNNMIDTYLRAQIHERLSGVWINFRLEIMVGIIAGISPFMIALMKTNGWNLSSTQGNNAIYGTILTNIFLLGNAIGFFVFSFSEVAKGMSSVQRLVEYIEYDIHERPWDTPKAPQNWPQEGRIELKNLTLRYRAKLPLVIKGLDFSIEKNQKIGIVGRTGSGKSTILLSLMRILEMEEDENHKPVGSIEIDGVRIDSIGLHELRKNITVIPQDPFLIQGTLRFNIDPLEKYTEEEILESLRTVQILDTIRTEDIIDQKIKSYKTKQAAIKTATKKNARPSVSERTDAEDEDPEIQKLRKATVTDKEKLDFQVDAGGSNLSIGQRQLICIARSLIRKPKILLMDEATANIDQKTDSIIQRVIKYNLSNTTVITIAHRLVTIIQYDKILILENGSKKEEGSPLELLQSHGYFYKLVHEGGKEFEEKMFKLAQNRELDPNLI
jgi:ABC-type multidrug transport system fused ATPase/permease subunit